VLDQPVGMTPVAPIRPIYLIDWTTTWVSVDEVQCAQHALEEAARRVTSRGLDIRCLDSVYLPDERRWLCLLVADSPAAVELVADLAQIPHRHIRPGVDMMPDSSEDVDVVIGSAG
jgi:hypothetical protein